MPLAWLIRPFTVRAKLALQPRDRASERLDGGDLSALSCGVWGDAGVTRQLISCAQLAEADDRSIGLRRRRKPGPNFDPREGSRASDGSGASRVPYPRHLRRRVFPVGVHGDAAGVESLRRSLTAA